MPYSHKFLIWQINMSFNVIRENKSLAKVSEFTVTPHKQTWATHNWPYSKMPFKWCFTVEPIVARFYMLTYWERISIVVIAHTFFGKKKSRNTPASINGPTAKCHFKGVSL